ncbi:MAG: SusC/RagA family TonB-linked outer membrane protein, partial [Bacteroidota bacterium]
MKAQSTYQFSAANYVNVLPEQSQDQTLTSVLKTLEQEYDVQFYFDPSVLEGKTVKLQKNNQGLEAKLNKVLKPHQLVYKKLNEVSYVIRKGDDQPVIPKLEKRIPTKSESLPNINRGELGKVYRAEVVEQTISGKVTDLSTNEPLPGVNILAKETTTGTVTDVDGNYRLTVADEVTTLVFSSIGYETVEEKINGRSAINISLSPDIQSLSEVVVVGYGTQKRKDITGALSSVKSEELEKIVTPSVDQALQGQTPGLFVANSAGGAPGAAPTVRIRGSNSINSSNEPLYVIDGFPVYPNNGQIRGSGDFRTDQLSPNTSNILATINPNDIESIEVLKDASATAIYGSRGANGVIVITTKRGKNKRSNMNFDWYSGVSTITERLPLMNAGQYSRLANEYNAAFDVPPLFTEEQIRNFEQNGGTDWQDQIFRNALVNNFQLSSNGGNESTQHYLAANYYNEEGIIEGNNIQRFSLRANLDIAPSPKLKLGNSFTTSYTIENAVPNGGRDPATGPGVLISVLNFPPTDPVFNDDGSYNVFPSRSSAAIANPLAIVETQEIQYKSLRSLGTFFVDYEFLPGLTGRVNLGYDLLSRSESAYYPQETTLLGSEVGGAARRINIFDVTWLTDFLLTYNKSFGKHQINAVTGFTAQANTLERTLAARNNFVTDAFGTANLSGGALEVVPQSSLDEWSLVSWLGRVNYILSDRYLLTFSGRYDGSSRFAEGNKFGFFPSG